MKKLLVLALLVSSVLAFVVSSSANTGSTVKEHKMIDPTVWGATVSNLTAATPTLEIATVKIVGHATARETVQDIQIWACTPMTDNLVGGRNTTCSWL